MADRSTTVYENTSSSGVGSKVDLKFNPDTLRVEDLDEEDEDTMTMTTGTLIDPTKTYRILLKQKTKILLALTQKHSTEYAGVPEEK